MQNDGAQSVGPMVHCWHFFSVIVTEKSHLRVLNCNRAGLLLATTLWD